MNWLITGGCGFIGTSLVQYLINSRQDANIRILDNLSVGTKSDLAEVCNFKEYTPGSEPNFPQGVEFVLGDIRNTNDCLKACQGTDIIIHLAANSGVALSVEDPLKDMEANVNGTVNVLEAARFHNIKKFIFASSGAPIGDVEPPIHEGKVPRPVSPYGASKLAGEGYCSAYYRTFGIRTIALRFGNVYGPRSKHKSSVVAKFFRNAFLDQPLEIYGNGGQTRDFIYIEDLIQAIVLSAMAPLGGEVFQIATDKETTVNEIADHIKKIIKERMGKDLEVVHKGERPGDVMRNYSDISKAIKYLGFKPEYDLAEGLELTFNYFKKQADSSVKS